MDFNLNRIYSGAHRMNCSNRIDRERFGCLRHNCMSWPVSAMDQIWRNCCHSRKHEARNRRRHWSSPSIFTHRTDWFTAIQATTSIQRTRTTIRHHMIWNSMRIRRAPSVEQWPRICIGPNWSRWNKSISGKTSAISTITWVRTRRKLP